MDPLTRHVPADHPAFDGHFPGHPLWPGVAVLSEVLEALWADPVLAARLGPSPRLGTVKFLSPVRPGATLTIALMSEPNSVRFDVHDGTRLAASGQFEVAR